MSFVSNVWLVWFFFISCRRRQVHLRKRPAGANRLSEPPRLPSSSSASRRPRRPAPFFDDDGGDGVEDEDALLDDEEAMNRMLDCWANGRDATFAETGTDLDVSRLRFSFPSRGVVTPIWGRDPMGLFLLESLCVYASSWGRDPLGVVTHFGS